MVPEASRDVTTGPPKALPGSQQVVSVVTMVVVLMVMVVMWQMVSLAVRLSRGAKATAGPDILGGGIRAEIVENQKNFL